MTDSNFSYLPFKFDEIFYSKLGKRIKSIMSQFMQYIVSVFSGNQLSSGANSESKQNSHVTFAENSFTQAFNRSQIEQNSRLNSLRQSNKRTIVTNELLVLIAFLAHFSLITWPKMQLDSFDLFESEGWQLIALNLVPVAVQVASICAMLELNKPIPEGAKLTQKHSGLELKNNDFIHSLQVMILLMVMCQISSLYSEQLIWLALIIVPIWCYKLTSKMAQNEFDRHAPSPKKQLFKINIAKSPKAGSTPSKSNQQASAKKEVTAAQARATPRTRARRAVKNVISGVSDKYHAFEQNVAHQLSQKIFTPLSPRAKAIEA